MGFSGVRGVYRISSLVTSTNFNVIILETPKVNWIWSSKQACRQIVLSLAMSRWWNSYQDHVIMDKLWQTCFPLLCFICSKKPSQKVIVFVISRNSNYVSMMGLSVKTQHKSGFSLKKQTLFFPSSYIGSFNGKRSDLFLIDSIYVANQKIDPKNVQWNSFSNF